MALIRHLAWMSRIVYFSGRQSIAGWQRTDARSNISGFDAGCFVKANGKGFDIVIAFRGTEFYNEDYAGGQWSPRSVVRFAADLVADLNIISNISPQIVSARRYAQELIMGYVGTKRPVNIILTGHSLGAALAQSCSVVAPANARIVTFCSPLIAWDTHLGNALRGGCCPVLNIMVKGDMVSEKTGGDRMFLGSKKVLDVPHKDKHSMHQLAEHLSGNARDLGAVDVTAPDFNPALV